MARLVSVAMEVGPQQRQLPDGVLTMLFSDIEGSTKLLHEIGDQYGEVLDEHHRVLREVWSAHDGIEVHSDGDAFFVVFVDPRAALRAAAAAQAALSAHSWAHQQELRVRMGIHTGTALVRQDDYWGIDVHYAARLCSAAHGGQALLSAATRTLTPDIAAEDLGEHALKDFPAPRKLFHLVLDGRTSGDFPPPRTLDTVRSNLPSVPTAIVGRDLEVASVRDRFESGARLVTITGVGGSGKTRLALACGEALIGEFEDGAFLVTLASLGPDDDVALSIARTLGVPVEGGRDPESAVTAYLRQRRLLLILDNMEHLLPSAPIVARLVAAAAGLHVLVTSQAPLRVRGETVLPLDALAVPPAGATHPDVIAEIPAVVLLVERARAADPAFQLDAGNATAVAELCRRVAGMPLALELAAARLRLVSPERLVDVLGQSLDALGSGARDLPARQRGLRAALDWTLSLLDDDERTLFAALGAFADAWTVEQVERILGDELDVLESSASLLDFSLIRTRGDGRMTMPEAVRTYCRDALRLHPRGEQFRRLHAELFAEEAEAIDELVLADTDAQIARTVDLSHEFAAALHWSAQSDPAMHRRLVAALAKPTHFAETISPLMDDLRHLVAVDTSEDLVSVRLLLGVSLVSGSLGEASSSAEVAGRAAELARGLGDESAEIFALLQQAHMLSFLEPDEAAHARPLLERARCLAIVGRDRRLEQAIETEFAINRYAVGELDEAVELLSEITADASRTDLFSYCAESYLADCALEQHRWEDALQGFVRYIRTMRGTQVNNKLLQCGGITMALVGLERDREAIELWAAIEAIAERDGSIALRADMYPELPAGLAAARTRLGPTAVAEGERSGRARDLDDVIAWVFQMSAEVAVA